MVVVQQQQHRRKEHEESRKQVAFKYFLTLKNENHDMKRLQVCKVMFTSTLCIGFRQVRDWVLQADSPNALPVPNEGNSGNDTVKAGNVKEFLNSLPKVESHYCRASSRKLYLEPVWDSYRHLFWEFKDGYCVLKNKESCSWRYFMKNFRQLNLDIYLPRKDQCNKCMAFKRGNLTQIEYNNHQVKKTRAREEKANDKENSDNDILVYTADVQAVLLCPRVQASAMYYKTKLKVHNYTIYNLKTKDAACYIWHESNGGLDSDVFTSIVVQHLKDEIARYKPRKIILWSDGCTYQNRCVQLSNGLLQLAISEDVVIEQKYLEVGHTQMEVDSIHSSIEKKLPLHREIFVPADYIHVIRSARQIPTPYRVIPLTYNDFRNYSSGRYSSIRLGNKTGKPYVVDIVALLYLPSEGKIKYKLNFDDEWEYLPRRPVTVAETLDHPLLYHSPRPIDVNKFIHLQEMKPLIPADHHLFYDTLEHGCVNLESCSHIIRQIQKSRPKKK